MRNPADAQLVDDLLRLMVQSTNAIETVQRHQPRAVQQRRREMFNSIMRHAKGMSIAVAVLRRDVEQGQ